MTILFYLAMTFHVIACLFLIAVVLLQQGKGQDLASTFGGGVTQTAFGPRGSANILSRATTVLAGLFMVTSLALTVVRPRSSVLEQAGPGAPAAPAAAPAAPASNAPAADAPASAPAQNAPATSAPATAAPTK
jgi:preprotein translocase subunit SecG